MREVIRTEKYIMRPDDPYYEQMDQMCFNAKNLYNQSNYIVRQEFIKSGKWIRYEELDAITKEIEDYPDYKKMPGAQSAQQTLRQLDRDWSSFFKAIKDWKAHPEKYLGRPNLPKYKHKEKGRCVLYVTNQCAKVDGTRIKFPKTFNGYELDPLCIRRKGFKKINQVTFVPKNRYIEVEVVYTIEIGDLMKDNGRYLGVDLGIDNLAAIGNNFGQRPKIINGKGLKSENAYYNKMISNLRSLAKVCNDKNFTNRMYRLTNKRDMIIEDFMHKASRWLVNYAKENDVSVIIIGKNKGWKQSVSLGKHNNQNFVGIPFNRFIEMVQYKAEELQIRVELVEESYTSGTSFIDNELPIKKNYDKSRRKTRGQFISNSGVMINADVNSSYQMIKKVFGGSAFTNVENSIEGKAFYPEIINVCPMHRSKAKLLVV